MVVPNLSKVWPCTMPSVKPRRSRPAGISQIEFERTYRGAWKVRVSLGRDPSTGNWHTVQREFHGTKAQAEKFASRLQTEAGDGKFTIDRCTVAALLERFIEQRRHMDRAPRTIEGYESMAKWITAEIGTVQVRKLTGPSIDELMMKVEREKATNYRAKGGRSAADHYYRFFRAALRQGVRWGYLDVAPTERATAPSAPETDVHPPDPEVVRKMLVLAEESSHTGDLASFAWVAATTGRRLGELCALTVGAIDLDGAELLIGPTVSRSGGETIMRPIPKNKKPVRIAIDPGTVIVLDRQIRRIAKRCAAVGARVTPDTFIWSEEADHSEAMNPQLISDRWKRLRDKAGISSRLYDLRHFAATQMLAGGVDVVTAAKRLGHSPAVLLKTYAKVIPARDQDAAALLGASLGVTPKV